MKIRAINLDGMFFPTTYPEIEYKHLIFSGGEHHVELNNNINFCNIEKVIITQRIKNSEDLMKIFIVHDALKVKGIKDFDLIIPYVPYARQDRVCSDGQAFSLRVFAKLLNSANFNKVIVLDPHSDITPTLIENIDVIKNHQFVRDCLMYHFNISPISYKGRSPIVNKKNMPFIVSPDAGALKKIYPLAKYLKENGFETEVIEATKTRNPSTGKLSGFEVPGVQNLKGKDCFIVDDICDGGRTFLGTAEALKKKNSGKVYLVVTHGIFSQGIGTLLNGGIDGIYTSNSFKDIDDKTWGRLEKDENGFVYAGRQIVKQLKIQF
jgi:ribose-phosphate pyrophosphokinase